MLTKFAKIIKRELKFGLERLIFRKKNLEVQNFINQLLLKGEKRFPVILFIPGLSWDKQLTQRPHHLARALARQGALVFYLEPEIHADLAPLTKLDENLYWCNVPVTSFGLLDSMWVYILSWSIDYLKYLKKPRVIYDIVDDLSAFSGGVKEIQSNHLKRLELAELVLVSARNLMPLTEIYSAKALLCPNAVDFDLFNQLQRNGQSEYEIHNGMDRPKIGYIGAIANWIDFDLLREVIISRPNYQFIFIGPDNNGYLEKHELIEFPNVQWLGKQPYEKIPILFAEIDVGIIPFKLSPITHATSPLKLFEYYAAGKPVVITPMQESMQYPGVLVADTPGEFAFQLDKALMLTKDAAFQDMLVTFARENTWDERANQIMELIAPQNTNL